MAKKVKQQEKPFVPLSERAGRCGTCGECNFKSKVYRGDNPKFKGHILRGCQVCKEVFDTDTEKVLIKGELQNDN